MPKYKVQLQATVTATVWVECSDETEAKSIAENAWQPMLNGTGIDPTVHAVYRHDTPVSVNGVVARQIDEVQATVSSNWGRC